MTHPKPRIDTCRGRTARWPVITALGAAVLCGCSGEDAPSASGPPATLGRTLLEEPWFTDVAPQTELHFTHRTGATGEYLFPEITGSGCGLLDYDRDGDLDVYALQGATLSGTGTRNGGNRLFRNDLSATGWRFVDVTDTAGVGDTGYGMGCAVGDIDNDGDEDLYVTNVGANVLYRNRGDGTFIVDRTAIPSEDRWSTSATFLDYDRDGWLDLFVVNYVNFASGEIRPCHAASGARDYCGPQVYDPLPDRLFRNRGDGTFEDVTERAGIATTFGSGLGVVSADFNDDGWPDCYVANDGNANQLWINRGDGSFENTALVAGAAYNVDGMVEAGMGVTAGDFDCDADEDIFLAHLRGETNTLLINDGTGFFEDRTTEIGLGAVSRPWTGFGTGWVDFDGDGFLDLFIANGAVKMEEGLTGDPFPYGNPNQVLRNTGPPDFVYEWIGARAGREMGLIETSRGAAFGDLDNDGDVDVVVSNANGPLRLFRNEIGQRRSWLALELTGEQSNRDALGSRVVLDRPGARTLVRRVDTGGSYCSASDRRIVFGLGDDRGPQTVIVTWPDGNAERFSDLAPGRLHRLTEGRGAKAP